MLDSCYKIVLLSPWFVALGITLLQYDVRSVAEHVHIALVLGRFYSSINSPNILGSLSDDFSSYMKRFLLFISRNISIEKVNF